MKNDLEIQVIYLLESVDFENKTGILKLKEDRKYAHWVTLKVSISPLLLYRIRNKKYKDLMLGNQFMNTEYKSTLNSNKFYENPFRLIEFVPEGESDIPRNYRLELVFEMFSEKIKKVNAFHKLVVVGYRNRFLKPSQYIRFIQLTVTKKQSECKRQFLFAKES